MTGHREALAIVHRQPWLHIALYKFHTHVRQQGESVATFLAALETISEHCDFGEAISDMFVTGRTGVW